mgnify:CR=1 FL=1
MRSKPADQVISSIERKMPEEVRNAKFTVRDLTASENTTKARLHRAIPPELRRGLPPEFR